jgi:hypothetical protein
MKLLAENDAFWQFEISGVQSTRCAKL